MNQRGQRIVDEQTTAMFYNKGLNKEQWFGKRRRDREGKDLPVVPTHRCKNKDQAYKYSMPTNIQRPINLQWGLGVCVFVCARAGVCLCVSLSIYIYIFFF